jgi:hypothetical protein
VAGQGADVAVGGGAVTTTQLLRAAAAFGAAAGLATLLALHWANRRRRDAETVDPAGGWPEWLTRNAPDHTDAVIPAQRHGGTR